MKPGTYTAKAKDSLGQLCRTENKGTEYVGVDFLIVDEKGALTGDEITGSLWWTDATRDATRASLAMMGWQGEVDRSANLLGLSKVVQIGVCDEEYNGKVRNKVDWVGRPRGGVNQKDRLSLANAKSLISDMRQGLAVKPSNGRRPETGVNPDPDDRSDAY